MPSSEETQAALYEEIHSIAQTMQGIDPSLQDKPSLVDVISRAGHIQAVLAPHGPSGLSTCADWLDKMLTAALLDQFDEVPKGIALLDALIGWMENKLSPGAVGAPPPLQDLIAQAAALLHIPVPEQGPEPEQGDVSENDLDQLENAIADIYRNESPQAQSGPPPEDHPAPEPGGDPAVEADPPRENLEPEVLDFAGTMFDESLIYDFIDEAETHLEKIEPEILNLETDPENTSLVDEIFRPVHSIKGSAGFLGVKVLEGFAHEVENLLDAARKGTIPVSGSMAQTFLEAFDVIKTMLSQLRTVSDWHFSGEAGGSLPPVQVRQVLGRVRAHLSGTAHPAGTVEPKNDSDENLRIGEILLSEGNISNDDLQKALSLQNRGIGEILVAEGVVLPEKIQAALEKQHAVSDRPRGSIRVDIERLDNLMNLVGELVISQTQVADYFRKDGHFENDGEFGRNIGHLGKITKEMQDQVMSLRMVPLRPILQKMTRVVRDVAQKSGKNVRLLLSGEDTEVDKTVNEMLNDPLVHILRNSVDHGIETPTDRKAAGKSPEGVIHLSAKHEGGNIVIEISDDGKGLDKTRILRKAVEKGLVQADAQLSDSQIHQMIMSPGFSTAEKITDISGRGVGLDVVKRNIEQLRGNIEVQSTEGKGSRFTIRLPLTLAIIDGMLVLSGGNKFILPTLSIIRTLQPKPEEIKAIQGKGEVISTADDLWPLIRMDRLYGLRDVPIAPADGLAVIVENHKGENYALLVDELLGQQQVVVKSLGPLIPEGMGIAGGTILADGRVGLILDLAGIPAAFQKFRNSRRAKKSLPQENAPDPEDHDALVRMSS